RVTREACPRSATAPPAGKYAPPGRVPRVRLCHSMAPLTIPRMHDPATPHSRIIHKESKVIRVVQRGVKKKRIRLHLGQSSLHDIAQVAGQVLGGRHLRKGLPGMVPPARFEGAPGAESGGEAGGHLRIVPVELQDY